MGREYLETLASSSLAILKFDRQTSGASTHHLHHSSWGALHVIINLGVHPVKVKHDGMFVVHSMSSRLLHQVEGGALRLLQRGCVSICSAGADVFWDSRRRGL